MNAVTPVRGPAPEKPAKALRMERQDQEFLPSALEILETPPSPVRTALIFIICTFAVSTLVWSYFGRIDIVAIAQGKIQPTGRVKLIQPLETGKVAALHAENGRSVRQGEVLIELDASDARADEAALSASLLSSKAEQQRRHSALEAARTRAAAPVPGIVWDSSIPAVIRGREERVLAGDLGQLAAAVASLTAQRGQKAAESERLTQTIQAQNELLAILKQRVDMRAQLVKNGAGAAIGLIDANETYFYQRTALATQQGQLAESKSSIEVLTRDIEKARDNFIAENSQKLAEAERLVDDIDQKLAKARLRTARMSLTSPIDGTVQALSVTTVGQVVTTGEELMRIVPGDGGLEIECYLPNKDIGFVKPGQSAVVKIESFPFTRYGTLNAKVMRVAKDAIPEPDAQQIEGNPAKSAKSATFAGAQRTQNLVFPVTLALDASTIIADGAVVAVSPGMAVTIEIKTGDRRILSYIFSPLVEVTSEAFGER